MSETVPQKYCSPAVLWYITPQGRWEMLKIVGQLLIQPHESYIHFDCESSLQWWLIIPFL